jgi:hypothetical protein
MGNRPAVTARKLIGRASPLSLKHLQQQHIHPSLQRRSMKINNTSNSPQHPLLLLTFSPKTQNPLSSPFQMSARSIFWRWQNDSTVAEKQSGSMVTVVLWSLH